MTGFPKPKPHLLEKRAKAAARKAEDTRQRKLCHLRSGGRCEVVILILQPEKSALVWKRCLRSARHNHHLIGGSGRRNVGESIFATHRIDTCAICHTEITHAVLVPVNLDCAESASRVRYQRVH